MPDSPRILISQVWPGRQSWTEFLVVYEPAGWESTLPQFRLHVCHSPRTRIHYGPWNSTDWLLLLTCSARWAGARCRTFLTTSYKRFSRLLSMSRVRIDGSKKR
jgi:hypothetical protein